MKPRHALGYSRESRRPPWRRRPSRPSSTGSAAGPSGSTPTPPCARRRCCGCPPPSTSWSWRSRARTPTRACGGRPSSGSPRSAVLAEIAGRRRGRRRARRGGGPARPHRDPRAGRGGGAGGASLGLREAKHLAAWRRPPRSPATREAAHPRARRPEVPGRAWSASAQDPRTRLLALGRIEDGATLLALALNLEQKALAVAAVDRLSDPEALKAVAAKARRAGGGRAGARARGSRPASRPWPATRPRPVAAPAPADDEAERRAYEEARAALEREAAARPRPRRATASRAIEGARARRSRGPRASPCDQALVGPARGARGARRPGARRSRRPRSVTRRTWPPSRGLELALARGGGAGGQELGAPAPPSRRSTRRGEATAGADLPDCARASRRPPRCARGAARRERSAPRRTRRLDQLLRLADRAEALVAPGRRGVAARHRPRAARDQEALDAPRALPDPRASATQLLARLEAARRQLYPLLQQLREDVEWKRWANVVRAGGARARAPRRSSRSRTSSARRARCASSTRAGSRRRRPRRTRREALWTRFKAARDQVKARVDAFLAKQAEELAAQPREEGGAVREGRGARGVDRLAEDRRGAAHAAGRVEGDRPGAARGVAAGLGALPQALRPLLHALAGAPQRAQPRVGARTSRRRKPCARRPRRSRDSTEWEAGVGRASSSCRPSGARSAPVKKTPHRGDVAALPRRLRPLLRPLQEPRRARARGRPQDAREAICAELEALAPAGGRRRRAARRPRGAACRPRRRRGARRAACPRTSMAALDERFSAARDRLLELFPRAFEGSELDPEASRRRAEKLAARVEGAARGASRPGRRARPQNADGPRRAPARRARVEHDRRPGGRRGRLALGGRRDRGGAGAPGSASARCRGPRAARSSERFELACRRFHERAAAPGARAAAPRRRGRSGRARDRARAATGRDRAPAALTGGESAPPGATPRAVRARARPRRPTRRRSSRRYRSARVLAPFPRRGGEAGARWRRIIRVHERTLAVLDGRGRGRRAPGRERAARVRARPVRDAAAGRRAAALRRGPRAAQARRARRRLHLDARLGGRQALGAGLRPVAPRVPRHLLRQLRPQRLHGRARGRARRGGAAGCACWSSSRGRGAVRRSTRGRRRATCAQAFRAARGRRAAPRSSS